MPFQVLCRTLFKSLNCEDLLERLNALSILAAICVEQPSDRSNVTTDSLTGDVSRRVMKSHVLSQNFGVFHQLMQQFVASTHEQEQEHISLIFERFSLSSEFESQLRAHDPDFCFFSDVINSQNIVVSTRGCSTIRNACKSASSLAAVSKNELILSAMCAQLESEDVRADHVLHTLLLLTHVGDAGLIPIFDQDTVLASIVTQLGSSNPEFREISCRLLLAVSDSNERNIIMMKALPLPPLVAVIKAMPWTDSKVALLLLSNLCVFPEAQAFLHRDLSFIKDLAFNITHCKAVDSEKNQISLASLSCIAKLTRDYGPASRAHIQIIFSCPQILSSAKECLDVGGYDHQKVHFLNHAMEVFYNMSKMESSHKEMLDRRHQLLPLWCRFFDQISVPGQGAQASMPTLHLQYALLVLGNLIQSQTCPLEPFTIYSVNALFHKNLQVLFNRYCSVIDSEGDSVPPLKILTLCTLQLFVNDREVRKKLIESEKSDAPPTLIESMHAYLSRKQSRIAVADSVIDYVLKLLFSFTTNAEHLPVVISKTHSTGVHVLMEYMRLKPDVRVIVLKTLLNFSRCSDDASIATLTGAGGMRHLTEMLLNEFKRPSASTDEMHLCMSTLFNLRHMMKTDVSTRGFLLHPKEGDEYRNKVILTARSPHSDPIGASTRLICLKFISFLLEICQNDGNPKCAWNISLKLLLPQTPTGDIQPCIVDIAKLDAVPPEPDTEVQPSASHVDFSAAVAMFSDFVLADIARPLMEGTAASLADTEKAISQHACVVMCTIFCSTEPKLEDVLLKLSASGTKLYEPIVSHIVEASCPPLVIRGCKALACLSRNTKYTHIFSDPCMINTLLALLDQPATLRIFSQNDVNDVLDAIRGFCRNPKCIPYEHADIIVSVLSGWMGRVQQLQYKIATLEIIEQATQGFETPSKDIDVLLVAVAENTTFGLAFISEQLGSMVESPFPNCLSILYNILASRRVRELVTMPTSFHNCTDILCRLICSDSVASNIALSCLNLLCHDSDLTCGLIATEIIEFIMDRIMRNMGRSHGQSAFLQSNVDALQFLQFVFRARLRVVQMFDRVPQFFQEIVAIASADSEITRQHSSRLILSICSSEEPAVFEVLVQKDIFSFVSSLRDSQSENCAAIATQIACKMLLSPSCALQVEQRARLFCSLQCGIFSRFDCNWPTQQAPTTLKCAFEGSDVSNKVDFSCVALPGGHFNIRATQELILVEHDSALGSIYCIITVEPHATMHIILLQYRNVILQYLARLRAASSGAHLNPFFFSLDLQASMSAFTSHVAEFSHSTNVGANLIFVAVTSERLVWTSVSSTPALAHHRLFLPSSLHSNESNFDTAIGSSLLCHSERPATRCCFVIGSEGFCRYMSQPQVADAISVYANDGATVTQGQFLSTVKDLVNISTLGSAAGARVDDEQIPECSCILLHLQPRAYR